MHRTDHELEPPPSLYSFSGQEIQIHLRAKVPDKLQMLLDAENEKRNIFYVRQDILMAVNMKITAFCDIKSPCRDLSMFQLNLLPSASGYPENTLQHTFQLKI